MKEHVLPAIRNMKDLEKLIQTDYKVNISFKLINQKGLFQQKQKLFKKQNH